MTDSQGCTKPGCGHPDLAPGSTNRCRLHKNDLFVVGFTGTRRGMSLLQKQSTTDFIMELLSGNIDVMCLHGDCIGADDEFNDICKIIGIRRYCRPSNLTQRAYTDAVQIASSEHPLIRNKKIVDDSNHMLAAPFEMEEQRRGGTWSTIRYARKQGKDLNLLKR